MNFDKITDRICEADISADEFVTALGDDEDRDKVRGELKKREFLDMWNEYVKEGEHQDGNGFWENFETLPELVEDFLRYVSEPRFEDIPDELLDDYETN